MKSIYSYVDILKFQNTGVRLCQGWDNMESEGFIALNYLHSLQRLAIPHTYNIYSFIHTVFTQFIYSKSM